MPTLEERVAELEALIGASKKGSEIDSTTYNANNHLVVHSQSDDKIKKLPPTLLPFLSSEKETYYGNFRYLTGIPNDLDYTFADDFTLAKTIENKYYFISKLGDLNNHKIYLNNSGEFFRLNEANRVAEKKAWEIEGLTGTFTPNQLFKFNRWIESGYWKAPKVVVVAPHETFNFPKSFKDDVFIVEVYNDKGIPQPNGTFRLGGYLSASHQTILSAKQDSDGGNYGTAAHQFLIINQRKQTVIQYFDSYDDFPDPGDPNLLYVEEENDTTWFWSPGDNDYQSLGEVVRGELIDSTTFKDTLGVPVMPSPEKTYIDVTVTPKVEYLWDGAQYVPIGSTSSNQIIFYNSAGPPAVVGQSGILYIQIDSGATFIWNDGWISIGGGIASIVAGTNCNVDNTDPLNPIINVDDPDLSDYYDQEGTNAEIEAREQTWIIPISTFDEDVETGDVNGVIATFAFTITKAHATAFPVPVGGSGINVGIKKNGSSITSTLINVPSNVNNSTGATPAVFTDSNFAIGDRLNAYIDSVGSTMPGQNLNLVLTIKKL